MGFYGRFFRVDFLRKSMENLHRIEIAVQLSLILWIMLSILIFYATFEATAKMWGTLLLLFMVVIFTPFLPDGAGYEEVKNRTDSEDD